MTNGTTNGSGGLIGSSETVSANAGTALNRRSALAVLGLGSVGLALAGGASAQPLAAGAIAGGVLSAADLGWDDAAGKYILPPLPYAHNALEPHIDEQTMRIHHEKHHAAYVAGLNTALEKLKEARTAGGDPLITIQHWSRQLAFHGGGHINHTLFWHGMKPGDPTEPTGALRSQIESDFGSYDQFLAHFKAASNTVEGSGWGYLAWEPIAQKLLVLQMESQQKLMFAGVVPLLGVDVWEHAYYLRYQNKRADYVNAFLNVVHWEEIGRRFAAARGQSAMPAAAPANAPAATGG